MRATIKDVAAAAGVSLGTVSSVINGSRKIGVSAETKAKIQRIIKELNYQPSLAARAVAGASSRTIGILLYSTSDPYCAEMTELFQSQLNARGYMAFFGFWNDRVTEEDALRMILNFPICGLILPVGHHKKLSEDLPVSLMGNTIPDHFCVELDFGKAISDAVALLRGYGHRSCGYVCPREESVFELFQKEAAAQGIENRPEWNLSTPGAYDDAYEASLVALRRKDRPHAYICRNDSAALGMLNAAHTLGIPVPDALSVIGINDMKECAKAFPPLTTIHLPATEMVSALIDGVLTPGLTGVRTLYPKLVTRASTGVPVNMTQKNS